MSFLYSLNENQINMSIDFDNGTFSYSIVDDNVQNRKYTLDTSIACRVHLNLFWWETEVKLLKLMLQCSVKLKNWCNTATYFLKILTLTRYQV